MESETPENSDELARELEEGREEEAAAEAEGEDPGGPPPERLDEDPARNPEGPMKRLQGG